MILFRTSSKRLSTPYRRIKVGDRDPRRPRPGLRDRLSVRLSPLRSLEHCHREGYTHEEGFTHLYFLFKSVSPQTLSCTRCPCTSVVPVIPLGSRTATVTAAQLFTSFSTKRSAWSPCSNQRPCSEARVNLSISAVYSGAPFASLVNYPLSSLLCETGIDGGWPMVFYVPGESEECTFHTFLFARLLVPVS